MPAAFIMDTLVTLALRIMMFFIPDFFRYRGICTWSHLVNLVKNYMDTGMRIIVKNKRAKFLFKKQGDSVPPYRAMEKYELAFDSVCYINCENDKIYEENQIEIELKSDPLTRLNMQVLTNKIEEKFPSRDLNVMTDSKYERARHFTM